MWRTQDSLRKKKNDYEMLYVSRKRLSKRILDLRKGKMRET
jgi:hypothetical protein